MIKDILFFATIFIASAGFAEEQMLVAVHGRAIPAGISNPQHQEMLISGTTVSANIKVGTAEADRITKMGFAAFPISGVVVEECSDGVYVVTAGPGNFLPNKDGNEVYSPPSIVSFVCINK